MRSQESHIETTLARLLVAVICAGGLTLASCGGSDTDEFGPMPDPELAPAPTPGPGQLTLSVLPVLANSYVTLAPMGMADGTMIAKDEFSVYLLREGGGQITLAGPGSSATIETGRGYQDGMGNAARFWSSFGGIARGPHGDLFVADTNNRVVRKIDVNGVVTTLAGQPLTGEAYPCERADGRGAAARFCEPVSIGVDAAGNVYVAESGANSVGNRNPLRKITPEGVVSTLVPSMSRHVVFFTNAKPSVQLVVTSAGTVLAADLVDRVIWKVSPAGEVTVLSGTPADASGANLGHTDGAANEAKYDQLLSAAVSADERTLYVLESYTTSKARSIRQVDITSGTVTTSLRGENCGASSQVTRDALCDVHSISVNPRTGQLVGR